VDRYSNQASHEFKLQRGIPPAEIPDIGNFLVYESLCFTYAKFGQWEQCEAAARYLQHIAPQQPSGYQLRGAAYFNLGRYSDAAEQFLAGLLVNPDKQDWYTSLSTTYEKLGLETNPVVNQGISFSLNSDVPLVREQLNRAAEMVVRLFEEARKLDEARQLRDRVIKEYSVPRGVFAGKS